MASAPINTINRLLAVVDSPTDAGDAITALVDAGIPRTGITLLHGAGAAERIDSRGRAGGAWSRVTRTLAFMAADQSVDLAWYEAALREGRAVLIIEAPDRRSTAVDILSRAGAHFINYYGRLATEDISAWRGPPPTISWTHHR